MSILIVIGTLILPILLLGIVWLSPTVGLFIEAGAVLCAYIFGIIAALSIYQIIHDHTVFMTNIHAVFTSFAFLSSGAYLGIYGLYKLIRSAFIMWRTL